MSFATHFIAFPRQIEDMVGVVLVESVSCFDKENRCWVLDSRSVWDNCFSVGSKENDVFWHECRFQRFGFEIYERRESIIYCLEIWVLERVCVEKCVRLVQSLTVERGFKCLLGIGIRMDLRSLVC